MVQAINKLKKLLDKASPQEIEREIKKLDKLLKEIPFPWDKGSEKDKEKKREKIRKEIEKSCQFLKLF